MKQRGDAVSQRSLYFSPGALATSLMTVSAHLIFGCPDPLIREQRHTGFEPDLLRLHRREILQIERPFLGEPFQLIVEIGAAGLLLDENDIDPVLCGEMVDPLDQAHAFGWSG